jgi:hypothetical protein
MLTPKQRMLSAYRGIPSDRPPVAPEFWYYYPAKILGVDMVEFQREVPFWQALQAAFARHGCEGWGIAGAAVRNPDREVERGFCQIGEGRYRQRVTTTFRGKAFTSTAIFDRTQPSWAEQRPVDSPGDLPLWVEMQLADEDEYSFAQANEAHRGVGEDYLLEFSLGVPFFDFMAGAMGFEETVLYFLSGGEGRLDSWRARYTAHRLALVRQACRETPFESFFIGCSYSCNSLIGPKMWRHWDKPYIRAIADEVHRHGKLLHVHFHGDSIATAADFCELGLDCVCPFERPPGGDIAGRAGLEAVRRQLGDRVTMNGNVHTVETLIRGTPADVRREVLEILEVFAGSARLIVGTGDQVGRETPEENIEAMIETVKG